MQNPLALFRRKLLRWFDAHRRDLPWRLPNRTNSRTNCELPLQLDPYHVLVSELMLQQTQVATVIPYFERFIACFPTIADLAAADEQQVLRLWQGLGYYSRARNLRRAARQVMDEHAGQLPRDVDSLRRLPGVGRYTAGAVASIAFEQPAPILDANVTRLLCRLDRIAADPREPATRELLWARAEQLLPKKRIGDFNSALMELGALLCTPRSPQCLLCPVRAHCDAFAAGVQEKIPAPRKAKPTPLLSRWTFCIQHGGKWLIEQRPPRGRWAGMWQFVTIEPCGSNPTATLLAKSLAATLRLRISTPVSLGTISHALTHRRYEFSIFRCAARTKALIPSPQQRRWITLQQLPTYPLPRPHVKIAAMLPRPKGR